VPNRRLRSDFDRPLPAPIPVSDLGGLPNGARSLRHHRKVRHSLALEAGPPYLAATAWRGRLVERSVQLQTADEGDLAFRLTAAVEELQGCVSAVGDGHYLSFGIPVPDQKQKLPGPLRLSSCVACPARRRSARKEPGHREKARPRPARPKGSLHQQNHAHPPQSAALHEVFMSGTHRVAVDALGSNLLAPTSLQRLVDAHNRRTFGHERLHQQSQEHVTRPPTRPASAAKHPMVAMVALLLVQAHRA
jgi:hypothetical protein